MCGRVKSFAKDNKNMQISGDIPSEENSRTRAPQEIAYEKGKKFIDVDGVFPCLYVLGGSNGCAMLVSFQLQYQSDTV